MRLIRKFAVQGHAVPRNVSAPRGPFPPELYQRPKYNSGEQPESKPEAYDNVRMFLCKYCGDVLREEHLEDHYCDEDD